MEIVSRLATDCDLDQIKKLWKEAFSDTDSFIDWNFKNNYTKENTFLLDMGKEIVSHTQVIPHMLIADKKRLKTAYIWGMLTKKEYQGKGFARRCFQYVMPKLYKRGYDISLLTSAVGDMYKKFGYETICQAKSGKEPSGYTEISDNIAENLNSRYLEFVSDKKIYIERPKEYWGKIIDDIKKASYGKIKVKDRGYALLYPGEIGYTAGEIIGDDTEETASMPVMFRVINAEGFAKKFSEYIKEETVISMSDSYIKENNINILFKDGTASLCDKKGIKMDILEFGRMMISAVAKKEEIYIKFPL